MCEFTARHQASKRAPERLARAKAKGGKAPTLRCHICHLVTVRRLPTPPGLFREKKTNLHEASEPKPLNLYRRLLLLCRFHQQQQNKKAS